MSHTQEGGGDKHFSRGEHFPEFAKNHWGKGPNFWDLGKSSMKFNSVRVVAIWDGEVLTA